MDQWSIAVKQAGESLDDYVKRILQSKLFAARYHDNAGFLLSTSGAAAQNRWVQTLPNIYYYSFVSDASYDWRDLFFQKIALPNLLVTSPGMVPQVTLLGSRVVSALGLSDDWLRNDGACSVYSMPSDGIAPVINFSGTSKRGTWVTFKPMAMDHLGIMGTNPTIPVYSVYKTHIALITNLPSHEQLNSKRALRAGAMMEEEHHAPAALVADVLAAHHPLLIETKQ